MRINVFTAIILKIRIIKLFTTFKIVIFCTIDSIWLWTKWKITRTKIDRLLLWMWTPFLKEIAYSWQTGTPLHNWIDLTHCFWSTQDVVVNPADANCLHFPLHGTLQFCLNPWHLTFPSISLKQVSWLQQLWVTESAEVRVSLPHKHKWSSASPKHWSPHNHSVNQSHSILWQRLLDAKLIKRKISTTCILSRRTNFVF